MVTADGKKHYLAEPLQLALGLEKRGLASRPSLPLVAFNHGSKPRQLGRLE